MARHGFRSFHTSRPRKVRGGIQARSQRGAFGESWWGRRWIQVLEGLRIGGRLERGRLYARRGQVLNIDISKGRVSARVQGSRPKPYDVVMKVKMLSPGEWHRLAAVLSRQAIFGAKLLAGEMPRDIEQAFKASGLSLFPAKLRDLSTECSCPDWSNPCKHIAAVFYLLGEEFDRDPFLIFKLRGLTRGELVGLLNNNRAHAPRARRSRRPQGPPPAPTPVRTEEPPVTVEPLPVEPTEFWNVKPPGDVFSETQVPTVSAALPKRLGTFPFWRSKEPFIGAMESIYRHAAPAGLAVFLGMQDQE